MRDRFEDLIDRLKNPDSTTLTDIVGETHLQKEIRGLESFAIQFAWDFVIWDLEEGKKIEPQEFAQRLSRFVKTGEANLRATGLIEEASVMRLLNCEAVAVIFRTSLEESMPGIEVSDEFLESMKDSNMKAYVELIHVAKKAAELDGSSGRYEAV